MKKLFCSNCGKRQTLKSKKCLECGKKIITRNHPIQDVMYEYVSDDLKGKVKDNIFSILTNFIKSHLYGVILTLTVIGTVTASLVSNYVNKPKVTTEIPEFVEAARYTNSQNLVTGFIAALSSGDEKTVKSMMYETYYPEKYKEYYSESEHYITSEYGKPTISVYDVTKYLNEFSESKKYYSTEFHDHYLSTAEFAIEHEHFDERYFEEVEKMAYDGKDVVEGFFSMNYCIHPETCEYDFDFFISSFYLLIKEDENWYVYKTLSTDRAFEPFKRYNGDINEILKVDWRDDSLWNA